MQYLSASQARVLVTNQIGILPQCDVVMVMLDGVITEVGTYNELIDNGGALAQFLHTNQRACTTEEINSGVTKS